MKKIIFLLAFLLLFSGCTQKKVEYIPGMLMESHLDFTPYSEKGFSFTPYEYMGEYDGIGIINIKVYPKAEYKVKNLVNPEDAKLYEGVMVDRVWVQGKINPELLLDMAYNKAVAMGADAITSLNLNPIENWVYVDLTIYGLQLTGFAIKRK